MCSLCRWCAFIDVHINCECSPATLYHHLSVSLRPWCNLCMMDVDSDNRVCFQTQPNFQRWKGRQSANKSFLIDLRYSWTLWLAGSPVNCFQKVGQLRIRETFEKTPCKFLLQSIPEGNVRIGLRRELTDATPDVAAKCACRWIYDRGSGMQHVVTNHVISNFY